MGKILSVTEAVNVLLKGQIVGLPTETVYGLGADATNEAAIAEVFKAKNRPSFDPLIVHVPTLDAVKEIAELSEGSRTTFPCF
jgi:L-threonylcarbamoyladenylate synthase